MRGGRRKALFGLLPLPPLLLLLWEPAAAAALLGGELQALLLVLLSRGTARLLLGANPSRAGVVALAMMKFPLLLAALYLGLVVLGLQAVWFTLGFSVALPLLLVLTWAGGAEERKS